MIEIPELKITKVTYRLLIEDMVRFMNFPEAGLRGAMGYFWNNGGARFTPLYETFFGPPDGITPPKAAMLYVSRCKGETDKVLLEVTFFGNRESLIDDFSKTLLVLGKEGIGKRRNRFVVEGMTTPRINTLQELVESHPCMPVDECTLKLKTPLSLRSAQGGILKTWNCLEFGRNLIHRIQGVAETYGTPVDSWNESLLLDAFFGLQGEADVRIEQQNRTSSRQQKNIDYSGIVGKVLLKNVPEDIVTLIRMGEHLAVGKNAVFGSGRIRLIL